MSIRYSFCLKYEISISFVLKKFKKKLYAVTHSISMRHLDKNLYFVFFILQPYTDIKL